MAFIYQRHKSAAVDMGVNLRRRDVGMSQHRLQCAQISAPSQQMRGKGMAQHMRADFGGVKPRFARKTANSLGLKISNTMLVQATKIIE